MKTNRILLLCIGALACLVVAETKAANYDHRATRLGNPATRFAPPLTHKDGIRIRFADPSLTADIKSICQQAGWPGDVADLFDAAQNAEVQEIGIPTGTIMPFMSSRKNRKPICMTRVLWAGKEPIQASAFIFVSRGIRYRCVMPWPCSNFYLEDAPPTHTTLVIKCKSPERQFTGRPMKVCFVVSNTGSVDEPGATVTVALPAGTSVKAVSDGAVISNGKLIWTLDNLEPGKGKEVCAEIVTTQPGPVHFKASLKGVNADPTDCGCQTEVLGVYALLVEVIDLKDPIRFGDEVEYVITAKNQGEQSHSNLRVVARLPRDQEFVSGRGASAVSAVDRLITMAPVPTLAGKATATWNVRTRAVNNSGSTGLTDTRFTVEFSTDQITNPIREQESTQLY